MKIAVLGASLSAQTKNHKSGEITGYVEAFRDKYSLSINIEPEDIIQFAYGGNRLSDAGLIRLEELIISKPDICIIEPIVEDVSRGTEANELIYLHVFKRLIENNISPIVFCVPLPTTNKVIDSQRYRTCVEVCNKYNIPLKTVNISKAINNGLAFNGLHTDISTAYFLASELNEFLRDSNQTNSRKTLSAPLPNSNILIQQINDSTAKKIQSINIHFHAKSAGRLTLIQKQNIGPYSPIIDIAIHQKISKTEEKSIWDRFCYYQRSSYVTLCDVYIESGSGNLLINISKTKPKYSTCKKHQGSWPKPNELRIAPLSNITSISNFEIDFLDVAIT